MSGVDRADHLWMQYATCRKAVKWWKYVFWFLFDIAICNAIVCMRESASHQLISRRGKVKLRTQIDFQIKLAEQMIGDFRSPRKWKSTPTVDLAGFSHWPVLGEKPGRCKRRWYSSNSYLMAQWAFCSEETTTTCKDVSSIKRQWSAFSATAELLYMLTHNSSRVCALRYIGMHYMSNVAEDSSVLLAHSVATRVPTILHRVMGTARNLWWPNNRDRICQIFHNICRTRVQVILRTVWKLGVDWMRGTDTFRR